MAETQEREWRCPECGVDGGEVVGMGHLSVCSENEKSRQRARQRARRVEAQDAARYRLLRPHLDLYGTKAHVYPILGWQELAMPAKDGGYENVDEALDEEIARRGQ